MLFLLCYTYRYGTVINQVSKYGKIIRFFTFDSRNTHVDVEKYNKESKTVKFL